jgi:polar amino acid transport system substrate-binding protein
MPDGIARVCSTVPVGMTQQSPGRCRHTEAERKFAGGSMRRSQRWYFILHGLAFLPWGAAAVQAAPAGQDQAVDVSQATRRIRLARIATGNQALDAERALQQVYRALGITVEFVQVPAARALVESNAGRLDGELARVAGIESIYPNLLRIEPVLFFNDNAVFVLKSQHAAPQDLKALARLPVVGLLNGYKITEELTAGWSNILQINSYASALKMLVAGRISAFFGRKEDVQFAMIELGLDASSFDVQVLLSVPLYHYLNKKHEALLPAITAELRQLQANQGGVLRTPRPGPH